MAKRRRRNQTEPTPQCEATVTKYSDTTSAMTVQRGKGAGSENLTFGVWVRTITNGFGEGLKLPGDVNQR